MIAPGDRAYLDEALQLAKRGLFTTPPNPHVGCVIVRDGLVLGRGWHQWCGEAHAEIRAMQDAGGDVAGATVYVTLEPCCVHGRTPPCTDALIAAKVHRVVAGALDPEARGRGLQRLRAAGIVAELTQHDGAQRLNATHRHRMEQGRPWVRIKLACSLDGRTAMASGESQWITGPQARRDGQYWRARSCALITGIGTVRADDPLLTLRDSQFAVNGRLRQPLRIVVDSRGRTGTDARVFSDPGALLIAHATAEPAARTRAEYVRLSGDDGAVDLEGLLRLLAKRPCNEVLVEAGATLAGTFVATGLWDELLLYLAPSFLGTSARPLLGIPMQRLEEAISGRIVDTKPFGPDLRLRLARV